MNTTNQSHWDAVYRQKSEAQTSWFRPHLDASLQLIDALDLPREAALLDVGGGRATLADDLLARGFEDVTVLDVSGVALTEARTRLGARGESVRWIIGDVTGVELPRAKYALWHDRAVFHFLTEPAAQERYVDAAAQSVVVGGYAVIATFATDGPQRCSGLAVSRYDADALVARFAPAFARTADRREMHRTPAGHEQPFTYVVLRRRGAKSGANGYAAC